MKKIKVESPKRKPSRICDLIKDEQGNVIMEIKFHNTEVIEVDITEHLMQLGAI